MNFRADFSVIEQQQNISHFALTLHNLNDESVEISSLNFIFDRFITPSSVQPGTLKQVGSHCIYSPIHSDLQANTSLYIEFSVNTFPLRYLSDGLKGASLLLKGTDTLVPVTVTPAVLVSPTNQKINIEHVTPYKYPLIPMPNRLDELTGRLEIKPGLSLIASHPLSINAITWLTQESKRIHNLDFTQASKGTDFCLDFTLNPVLNNEAYRFSITEKGGLIEASSSAGFQHASATLLQLISKDNHLQSYFLPALTVNDQPRFRYRGFMLDCARHFHSVASVKRVINQLAHYKLNTFHWHLTDDEAWRIEIIALPALTDIGAWRGPESALEPQFSHVDSQYGGFYTQKEIREVIRYAATRGITVIPEIDIPGHCRAAIRSLPDLLVDSNDQSNYRSVQNYTDNVLSPALPGTYQFLDLVLTEIADLFPGKWVHMGADEVPEGVWVNSEACRQLMADQGYKTPQELQGHLLRYAERKLKALGKRMVGWEEAQHGNKVSKETVIYSWLSEQAAINCAKQGFDVILQPAQSTYLDMAQSLSYLEPGVDWANAISLSQAYHYQPLQSLDENDAIHKRVLGVQTAIWCEIIPDQERLDYMLFPRITALAEVMWSHREQRHWGDYLTRLKGHLPILNQQGIAYREPWVN
ncbi:beta-N-acetylhexosaminidase [Vibrio sp. FNV 38]|nr:beta-N-acetylhexosaminidase [Vibrio sp. FNV 38]